MTGPLRRLTDAPDFDTFTHDELPSFACLRYTNPMRSVCARTDAEGSSERWPTSVQQDADAQQTKGQR